MAAHRLYKNFARNFTNGYVYGASQELRAGGTFSVGDRKALQREATQFAAKHYKDLHTVTTETPDYIGEYAVPIGQALWQTRHGKGNIGSWGANPREVTEAYKRLDRAAQALGPSRVRS